MAPKLEFYFDVQCPFAYLGSTQIRALSKAAGAELVYKPMLLGGVYTALDAGSPYKTPQAPQRVRMNALDARRWADFWRVPLHFPAGHPVHTVLAMRAVIASGDMPRAAHALFEAAWPRGEAVSDRNVILRTLSGAGFGDAEEILVRAESPAVKAELRERTDEAIGRGVFGAPTFFIGEQQFWGQDRLDFVARALGLSHHESPSPELTAPASSEVEIWFDYSSPFAYLAITQIERVAAEAGARVRYRPFLLGGLFRSIGTADVPMLAFSPAKQRYISQDLARWAAHWGVPFRFTTRFPMRTIAPLRVTCGLLREAPSDAPRLIQAIYRALWVEDRDISQPDVLREICGQHGLDPALVERADAPENKRALLEAGEEALALGLCGAPTCVVRGKLYWGQDRLGMVAAALAGFESS